MQKRRAKLRKNQDRISRQAATASPQQAQSAWTAAFAAQPRSVARSAASKRLGREARAQAESGGDHALDGRAGQAKTVGYRFVGDMAAVNIQARPQMGILRHGCKAMARDRQPERQRRIVQGLARRQDRKSTRLNSSHGYISYAVFCLK